MEPPWRTALAAAPMHEPPRILVAEDDPDMRRLVIEALLKDGYDVIAVPDGGRLLVTLAHEIVDDDGAELADLLVSDVRMPTCSGTEILEQLRASHRRMPVILMTAFGDAAKRDHVEALGALLFDKPFEMDDLRTAVASLLRRAV